MDSWLKARLIGEICFNFAKKKPDFLVANHFMMFHEVAKPFVFVSLSFTEQKQRPSTKQREPSWHSFVKC